jgi:hypothetical protein
VVGEQTVDPRREVPGQVPDGPGFGGHVVSVARRLDGSSAAPVAFGEIAVLGSAKPGGG